MPFLQDIFMEIDLLLKGLDFLTAQPFIGLTVYSMFHHSIWLYDHMISHCGILLPFLLLLLLLHHTYEDCLYTYRIFPPYVAL